MRGPLVLRAAERASEAKSVVRESTQLLSGEAEREERERERERADLCSLPSLCLHSLLWGPPTSPPFQESSPSLGPCPLCPAVRTPPSVGLRTGGTLLDGGALLLTKREKAKATERKKKKSRRAEEQRRRATLRSPPSPSPPRTEGPPRSQHNTRLYLSLPSRRERPCAKRP